MRRRRATSRKPAKAQQTIKAKRGTASKPARHGRLSRSEDAEVIQLARELAEAREQQAATSEILRVIRSSPNSAQPVFDTIAANAVRLCGARMGAVHLFDGKLVDIVAFHNFPPEVVEVLRRMYPRPPQIDQASGRAILSRAVAQIEDMPADPKYTSEVTVAGRWRSILAVPMFRDDDPIGAIVITRSEVGRFAEGHIDLLRTFADQAAIAIDNVRLFEAEQRRTRELTESLQQQTATADVLKVISRSTFDLQTVLDTLVESAARLCGAPHGLIFRYDGTSARAVAAYNNVPGFKELWADNPILPNRVTATGRALVERGVVHIPDVLADPEYNPPEGALKRAQQLGNYRTTLGACLRNT